VLQDESVRVRITQDFLDYIRPKLPDLIRAAVGSSVNVDADGVVHIPIPDADLFDIGVAEARLREGEALIWLHDLENRLDVRFEEPNYVHLTLTNLRLGVRLDLREDVAGTTSSCPIEGDLGPLGPGPLTHAAEITIDAIIDPGVGPQPTYDLDVRVQVGDAAINDLDVHVGDYCAESQCQDCVLEEPFGNNCLDPGGRCAECHIFCGGLTDGLLSLASALIDLIKPLLNRLLQPIVENLVQNALNDLNGSSAKLESQISLADLAGISAFRAANPIGVLIAPEPGRFPVLNRGTGLGMEIDIDGGAEGPIADCIGELDDFVATRGPVPDLLGTDSMNRPYHVGATLASSFLNQVLYAAHRSGSLCLKLGSADVRDLTGGRFTLNASLLSILASDLAKLAEDTAPVILELKPRKPGWVELGSGELIGQNMMGNDVYDWLIKLSLEQLGIAFHVQMHDRYVRVFEVTTDIFVGLNINILPDNSLEIAVGELRIDNFEETFNELFPNADFGEVLPTLLDIALGAFLNQALVFDVDLTNAVSDALGGAPIYMRINDLFRDGVQEDYLSLSITFTDTPGGNLSLAAETIASLHAEPELIERIDGANRATGRVRLAVGRQELVYQARVDSGLWRVPVSPQADGTIVVEDPKLKMPGHHTIEVRARYAGDYQSLDATPVELSATVDPVAPRVAAEIGEGAVLARIEDTLTRDPSALRLFARTGAEQFEVPVAPLGEGAASAEIDLASLTGAEGIELQAVDGAGNQSPIVRLRLGLSAAEQSEESGCSCSATESAREAPMWLLLGLLLWRTRRRR
jgi:MYXO-CTERM domain-containing protein